MDGDKIIHYKDVDSTNEEYEAQSNELAKHFSITVEELREAQKNWDRPNEKFEVALARIKAKGT